MNHIFRALSLTLGIYLSNGCGKPSDSMNRSTPEPANDAAAMPSCPKWEILGKHAGFAVRYCNGGSDSREFVERLELREETLSITVPLYHSSSCDLFADWETNTTANALSVKLFPRPISDSGGCLLVVTPYLLQFQFHLPRPGDYSVTVTNQVREKPIEEKAIIELK